MLLWVGLWDLLHVHMRTIIVHVHVQCGSTVHVTVLSFHRLLMPQWRHTPWHATSVNALCRSTSLLMWSHLLSLLRPCTLPSGWRSWEFGYDTCMYMYTFTLLRYSTVVVRYFNFFMRATVAVADCQSNIHVQFPLLCLGFCFCCAHAKTKFVMLFPLWFWST